ncbi:olfactory receptor 1M1-like [Polypterus senegalus]|uniref:olfactory receptor 1M1-like n=1 Tax=Polypterus senegalus TaxID=55291 RepID=UPI001962BF35|nr:olfactory receptor 1M1-like [Polypterus senegalus]
MSSHSVTNSMNETLIHPEMFYISGLNDLLFANYFYIFLFIVYIFTIFANVFVILLIYFDQNLHNPKYIAVSHLTCADLCTSTALIPKMIEIFLFKSNLITYSACLVNMFFVHFFNVIQSLSLAILAYDRLIAICYPLQYHSINTNSRMVIIIFSAWMLCALLLSTMVLLIRRLSFCQSVVINSYFCDHGPVYKLACNDFHLNLIIGFVCIALLLFAPLTFILISYVAIGLALQKIATADGRQKALKTCTSHIILVAMFYLPVAITYVASQFANIHPNARILSNSMAVTIPPMLNPIVYTLKTEEMMDSIKKYYKRKRNQKK